MSFLTGQCLCGDTAFTIDNSQAEPLGRATACHCGMCRRQGGGGAFYSAEIKGRLEFTKADGLKWYRGSAWGERGFCAHCGTMLFWRLQSDGATIDVNLASLDNNPISKMDAHIFVDHSADYISIPDDAPHMTAQQVLAAYKESTS